MDNEETTRSGRRWLAAVLAGALLAAGCGSDDDAEADEDTGSAPETESETAAGAFPVTLEHKYGETTIEAQPERVVTVGLVEQDVLLALGVAPVATTEWFGEQPGAIWPWAQDELEALGADTPESLGDSAALNVEAVAKQEPDLIIAVYAGLTEEDYGQLSAIAPTVAQPGDYVDFGVPWDEATRLVGAAVGRADEADALVEEVEAQYAEVRESHPEFAEATAVAATPYEGTFVYGREDPRGDLLEALGFSLPEGIDEAVGEEFGASISEERTDLLDADVIIWLDADDAEGPLGGPLYAALDVHKEGREVHLDSFEETLGAATSFVTPLSLPFLLEGLVPKLEAALDGDPTTPVP